MARETLRFVQGLPRNPQNIFLRIFNKNHFPQVCFFQNRKSQNSGNPFPQVHSQVPRIIPLLYKLFARLLYNWLELLPDQHQSADQAGFRHDYCTRGHLFLGTCWRTWGKLEKPKIL